MKRAAVSRLIAVIFMMSVGLTLSARQSVGLVLSGGGAKGIAHIGVIRALEENNIPIDYITGTSMGSIVGGLYACGYTPDEMMELLLSKDFSYWSTGRIDPDLEYYFSEEQPLPTLYTYDVNIYPHDTTRMMRRAVPASLINPLPMNFAFMDLFAAYSAQCHDNFDNLFVPFRCVASDVEAGHKVVHHSGSLGDAIRTSMSFPVVFQPIKMNGVLLYDGGIYDNFPVDVMTEEFNPDIMLGVSVGASEVGPQTSIMDQIDNLVIRKQNKEVPADLGIKLRINLDEFSLLDFQAAREIEKIGYEHTMAIMDSIKTRITARTAPGEVEASRRAFKAATPTVVFDSVNVEGGNAGQNHYVKFLFESGHTDTFDIKQARTAFYRAISPGRLKDLYPQAVYNDSTGRFGLNLKVSPKNRLSLGVGGYLTSSTNSFVFLNTAWRTMSFNSLNFKLNGWIGQSYLAAMLTGSVNLRTHVPTSVDVTAVVSRQRFYDSDQLFYQIQGPSFVSYYEYFGRAEYSVATSSRGKFTAGIGYGWLNDTYYSKTDETFDTKKKNDIHYRLAQLRVAYTSSTLDNVVMPTAGHEYRFTAMGLTGSYDTYMYNEDNEWKHGAHWIQVESVTRNYWDLDKHFSFGLETDLFYSSRKKVGTTYMNNVTSTGYYPTPATYNCYNENLRGDAFAAIGIVPIYKYNSSLSARLNLSVFEPFHPRAKGFANFIGSPRVFGELAVNYAFPFANLTAYANYSTGRSRAWSAGISFGLFILAPKYLR